MSTKGRIVTLLTGDCNTTRFTNSLELEFFSIYISNMGFLTVKDSFRSLPITQSYLTMTRVLKGGYSGFYNLSLNKSSNIS